MNDKKPFFTSADHYKGYHLWSCQNVCDALSFLLDNNYIRVGTKLYRQIVGSDTEAPFLDLHLSISNGFVSSRIYDKRDDFDFDIVNYANLYTTL